MLNKLQVVEDELVYLHLHGRLEIRLQHGCVVLHNMGLLETFQSRNLFHFESKIRKTSQKGLEHIYILHLERRFKKKSPRCLCTALCTHCYKIQDEFI